MDLRTWFRVCLEKKTPDLFLLIAYPDQLQYFSIVFTRLDASFLQALENKTTSSAYITWVMVGPLILVLMLETFFSLSSWSIILDNTSCPKIKRYGESGSPCLSPLLGLKLSDLPPFTITSKDTDETQAMIQLVKVSLNPKWRRTNSRNFQFTLSYAFWRSSLITMSPGLVLRVLKLWRTSWTMI